MGLSLDETGGLLSPDGGDKTSIPLHEGTSVPVVVAVAVTCGVLFLVCLVSCCLLLRRRHIGQRKGSDRWVLIRNPFSAQSAPVADQQLSTQRKDHLHHLTTGPFISDRDELQMDELLGIKSPEPASSSQHYRRRQSVPNLSPPLMMGQSNRAKPRERVFPSFIQRSKKPIENLAVSSGEETDSSLYSPTSDNSSTVSTAYGSHGTVVCCLSLSGRLLTVTVNKIEGMRDPTWQTSIPCIQIKLRLLPDPNRVHFVELFASGRGFIPVEDQSIKDYYHLVVDKTAAFDLREGEDLGRGSKLKITLLTNRARKSSRNKMVYGFAVLDLSGEIYGSLQSRRRAANTLIPIKRTDDFHKGTVTIGLRWEEPNIFVLRVHEPGDLHLVMDDIINSFTGVKLKASLYVVGRRVSKFTEFYPKGQRVKPFIAEIKLPQPLFQNVSTWIQLDVKARFYAGIAGFSTTEESLGTIRISMDQKSASSHLASCHWLAAKDQPGEEVSETYELK